MEHDLGISFRDTNEINKTLEFFQTRLDFASQLLENLHIISEEFYFDWFRRALQIAQHVLENLNELHIEARNIPGNLRAQVVDDLVCGAATLRSRATNPRAWPMTKGFHFHQDITLILFCGEKAHLSASPAGKGGRFRHSSDAALDFGEDSICLVK